MSDILTNWTKISLGVCAVIMTIGLATGHIKSDDWKYVIGTLIGVHGITSGINALRGKDG